MKPLGEVFYAATHWRRILRKRATSRAGVCRTRTNGLEGMASTRGDQLRKPWAALRKRRLPAGVSGRSASSGHLPRSRSNAIACRTTITSRVMAQSHVPADTASSAHAVLRVDPLWTGFLPAFSSPMPRR